MGSTKKFLAILMALCLAFSMSSIAFAGDAATAEVTPEPRVTEDGSIPLVVAYSPFSEKFSPFYGESGYDMDVVDMVCGSMMTTDRVGGIVYNAIEGETRAYNGTDHFYSGMADLSVVYDKDTNITTYTTKMRKDIKYSDGTPMTADDLIFTYYVYLDPGYVGSTTLSSYDIVGLKDYRTQTTSEIYGKYESLATAIQAAGHDHVWAEGDAWTKEQQDAYWAIFDAKWTEVCQAIVDTVMANYLTDEYATAVGSTAEAIAASEGLTVAYGMAMWGFGELGKDTTVFTAKDGKTFDFSKEEYPTIADYYAATFAAYAGDGEKFSATEHPAQDAAYVVVGTKNAFITQEGAKEPEMTDGIKNVSGIVRVDDYTVEVKTYGYSAPAVYSILGLAAAPKHYYGDGTYDYAANNFGHPFGDLSVVEAKTTVPLGAGPYKFVKYENKIVYFEANENYYKGAPKIKYMQWKETLAPDMVTAVTSGTADISDPSFNKTAADTIRSYNSNQELQGDKIVTNLVDNRGYGYIGLNSETISVGGKADSTESKYLRTAIATVIAAQREVAINSYYGPAASVINYPISNTSWAAPQKTDADYKQAFSTGIDGKDIFTADMDTPAKEAAALAAAVEYLKAAGYTYDDATAKFVMAPEGAKLEYEIIIPGDGTGDHPSFGILTEAKNQLEKIGIILTINDPADSNLMWDRLNAGTQEMWCAAWQSTIDPDMYQTYHSSGIVGRGGSDSNHYHIDDAELDQMIVDARVSDDQAYRKAMYKSCLDRIIDWAVEIPVYQRQNCMIFSPERINMDTVTKDITTYYGWGTEVQNLEMK